MKMIRYCLLLSALVAANVCYTQVLTLEEAISTALKNNYNILLARIDSASAALDNSYANAAFIPQINANAGRAWNVNAQKVEFADGRKRDTSGLKNNNINANVALNWTLFDGLRMFATRDRLAQLVELGELTVKNEVVNTIASVIATYYNVVQEKQQLRAIEEQMSINAERVKLADRRLSVGLGTRQELLQAQTDLNAQRSAQLGQRTAIEQLKQQLNQVMGVDIARSYDVLDTIPINPSIQLEEVRSAAETNNPQLLIARKNIEISNTVLRERKAEFLPTLSFTSAYSFTRNNNNAVVNVQAQPLFSLNRGLNYGFTASIPILNNFNTRRLVRQAKLDIRFNEIQLENQRSLLDLGIYNAFKTYQFQKQALELEESNIQLAKDNVFIAFERYRLGVSTYLELRDAQQSLETAYNRLIDARYNTKLAETELLRLRGDLVR
ncbi:MAG TPA: TolC family protein [Chitinophagaceae bacterium]|nr:TolC family protein [Chitinophagaceae bacterium]